MRPNNTYISLSELGSSGGYVNHAVSENIRSLYGSIYAAPIPTWVIFEEAGLPRVETAVGEHLYPDPVVLDVRQRG